jgi:hypothetical protein
MAIDPSSKTAEVSSRSQRARDSNDGLARAAARLRFVSRVPFLCECDSADCQELVLLSLEDFRRRRPGAVIASGHQRRRPAEA